MRKFAFILLTLAAGLPTAASAVAQTASAEQVKPANPGAVVAEVRRVLTARYVLPEKRPALDAVLAQGLSSGRYNVADPQVLAERIDADLTRVGQDRHLELSYDPARAQRLVAAQAAKAAKAAAQKPAASEIARQKREAQARNHGVAELRVLPGNIRYLSYDGFFWVEPETTAALDHAMRFLAEGDAIIIDMRENGGGSGDASHYLINNFVPTNKPIYTYYEEGGLPQKLILAEKPTAGPILGKPIYLLTSNETASAAEAFVGVVAGYRLAETVGEKTAGAGFENTFVVVDGGYVLSVSVGRVVIAPTGRDWEKVGIAATIPTPVAAALDVAQVHALKRLAATAPADERVALRARAEWIEARMEPRSPALPLTAYAGEFGERKVQLEEGKLQYQLGDRPRRLLVPLGGNLFALGDDHSVRIEFAASQDRATALQVLPVGEAPQGRYERTQ